jgi:hypothetical protein
MRDVPVGRIIRDQSAEWQAVDFAGEDHSLHSLARNGGRHSPIFFVRSSGNGASFGMNCPETFIGAGAATAPVGWLL